MCVSTYIFLVSCTVPPVLLESLGILLCGGPIPHSIRSWTSRVLQASETICIQKCYFYDFFEHEYTVKMIFQSCYWSTCLVFLIQNFTFNSICYLPFLCEIYMQFLGEDCKTESCTIFPPSVLITI